MKKTPKSEKNVRNKDDYTKRGNRYVVKWGSDKKMFIEDQHVDCKLISKSLIGESAQKLALEGQTWCNTYTFDITNHRNGPITIKRTLADTGIRLFTDDYVNYLRKNINNELIPEIMDAIGLFTNSDVVLQPGETKRITWTQLEGCTQYSTPDMPRGQWNHWIQIYYKDERGQNYTLFWSPYNNDYAFRETWMS